MIKLLPGERFERFIVGQAAAFPEPGDWFHAAPHRTGAPGMSRGRGLLAEGPYWIGSLELTPARRDVLDALVALDDPRLPTIVARYVDAGVVVLAAPVARPIEPILGECAPADRLGLSLDVAAELLELVPRLSVLPTLADGTIRLTDDGRLVLGGIFDGGRVEPGRAIGRLLRKWSGVELQRFAAVDRAVERLAEDGVDPAGVRASLLGTLRREGLRVHRRVASRAAGLPVEGGWGKRDDGEGRMGPGREDEDAYDADGGPTVVFDARSFAAALPKPLPPAAPRDLASEASRLRHFGEDTSGGAPTAVPDGDTGVDAEISPIEINPSGSDAPVVGSSVAQLPGGGAAEAPRGPSAWGVNDGPAQTGAATRTRVKPGQDPIFQVAPYLVGGAVIVLLIWLAVGR